MGGVKNSQNFYRSCKLFATKKWRNPPKAKPSTALRAMLAKSWMVSHLWGNRQLWELERNIFDTPSSKAHTHWWPFGSLAVWHLHSSGTIAQLYLYPASRPSRRRVTNSWKIPATRRATMGLAGRWVTNLITNQSLQYKSLQNKKIRSSWVAVAYVHFLLSSVRIA